VNSAAPQRGWHPELSAVVLGGLVAGTIDIGAASLIYWQDPIVIFHSIASGILGTASFRGGVVSASLGLGLQWAMSVIIAAIYVQVTNQIPTFRRAWIKGGLLAGVVIFLVMNYVVLPLSAVGRAPRFTALKFLENLLAMLLFGIIIAFFARRKAIIGRP